MIPPACSRSSLESPPSWMCAEYFSREGVEKAETPQLAPFRTKELCISVFTRALWQHMHDYSPGFISPNRILLHFTVTWAWTKHWHEINPSHKAATPLQALGTIHLFLTQNHSLGVGGPNPHSNQFTLGCQLQRIYSKGHSRTKPAEVHHQTCKAQVTKVDPPVLGCILKFCPWKSKTE